MELESIDAATAALTRYVPQTRAVRGSYTLDRLRAFLAHLGDPQDAVPVIHVAGTSGKTSTAYLIRGLLQHAGAVTGLTVSPHMSSLTERVQVDDVALPDDEFLRYLGRFLPIVDSSDVPLTYFEVLVAFAYWVFADRGVDYAVVETGLGGLLDGTNTVRRNDKVCVITDLGLDHTEVLGDTVDEIARQKAGIVQPGNHVLVIDQESSGLLAELSEQRGGTVQVIAVPEPAPVPALPSFQRRNWTLAGAAYDYLRTRDGLAPRPAEADTGAATELPPGRLERVTTRGRAVVLDGAHNPQELAALRAELEASGASGAAVLAGFLAAPDSKLDAALAELLPLAAHLIVPEFTVVPHLAKQSPPAAATAERARTIGFPSVQAEPDVPAAFAALLRRPEPALLVTGSLYLVSQVRDLVREWG